METGKYYILGRSGAGSLIVEFLLKEVGADYDISFGTSDDTTANDVNKYHPSGKIPVLICPSGNPVFETLAIVNHITDRFTSLVPKKGTTLNDRYWQFLSLLATSIYPAYHRQHHSHYYISEEGLKTFGVLYSCYLNNDFIFAAAADYCKEGTLGNWLGEIMNKKPHGDGVYFDEIGNKFVGEWKNGFAWNVKLYGTGGGLGGVYVKGKYIPK